MKMDVVEIDATASGRWKYAFCGEGDASFSLFGVFHTVEPNTLITQTFEFNLAPGQLTVQPHHGPTTDG